MPSSQMPSLFALPITKVRLTLERENSFIMRSAQTPTWSLISVYESRSLPHTVLLISANNFHFTSNMATAQLSSASKQTPVIRNTLSKETQWLRHSSRITMPPPRPPPNMISRLWKHPGRTWKNREKQTELENVALTHPLGWGAVAAAVSWEPKTVYLFDCVMATGLQCAGALVVSNWR